MLHDQAMHMLILGSNLIEWTQLTLVTVQKTISVLMMAENVFKHKLNAKFMLQTEGDDNLQYRLCISKWHKSYHQLPVIKHPTSVSVSHCIAYFCITLWSSESSRLTGYHDSSPGWVTEWEAATDSVSVWEAVVGCFTLPNNTLHCMGSWVGIMPKTSSCSPIHHL